MVVSSHSECGFENGRPCANYLWGVDYRFPRCDLFV
jgi:hypothetical protein